MSIFVIAEIGINHNGDIETCKKLIDHAADIGCDAVKFQKRDINIVYKKEFLDSYRESPWGSTQREQKMGLELNKDQYKIIDSYCKLKDIYWFASAWDINSQNFLKQFNCKFNKIASPMLIDKTFLNLVAEEKKHTFTLTGMSSFEDIKTAIKIFKNHDCKFELMHAVSTYPLKPKDANLRMIETLRKEFNCDVGYSGHESGLAISYAAAALGITSLERHITLDRTMYGSDQAASVEVNGLRTLVQTIRKIEKAMGDGKTRQIPEEMEVAKKLRAHIKI